MARSGDVYEEMHRLASKLTARAGTRIKPGRVRSTDLGTLYSLRMGAAKQGNYDMAGAAGLEIVWRECNSARRDISAKSHAKAVSALIWIMRQAAVSTKGAAGTARAMSRELLAGVANQSEWLRRYVEGAPRAAKAQHVTNLTGLSNTDWERFVSAVTSETSRRTSATSASVGEPGPVDLNVAARLARMAARESAAVVEAPSYDLSDRNVRIATVTVTGFRGSAGTVQLDLTKSGKPTDALLWGDNGVGKSTLIDGLEFALQHRVDRSSDFNSSLRPSVRNLATPSAVAEVKLSDGQSVTRSLVTNKAGRDEASHFDVRPGFRIAPVVIRRADILRFLDTDALSRGTVFFDYFPDPEGTLGIRPDEELRQLEEERFLLRVARDDLAAQLAARYPDAGADFSDTRGLEGFVAGLLDEANAADYEHPFDALGAEDRRIVAELQSAQRRSSAIKKQLDRGVQTLNPRAYQAQLARVVPILHTVTDDLTSSFKRISRATHVKKIQVLVAKSGPVSLDVVVEFDNGTSALPQQVFSEGNKDLIALLFFLTVTKKAAEFGQAKVLVLDDALQSVDATIRLGVMDYVLDEFKDWQVIVTGHDRAWFTQLRGLFQRRGRSPVERNIVGWSFADGIDVGGASRSRAESLREAVARADERAVASATGLLLEEVANELSWRLGTSVTRREGDRYTLGDLWPGVAKALKRTNLKRTVEEIDLRIDIRNLLGAHYNDWADGISWSDIRRLGEDALATYDATHCSSCNSWASRAGASVTCMCGNLVLL